MWKTRCFNNSKELNDFLNELHIMPGDCHITYDSEWRLYHVFYFG